MARFFVDEHLDRGEGAERGSLGSHPGDGDHDGGRAVEEEGRRMVAGRVGDDAEAAAARGLAAGVNASARKRPGLATVTRLVMLTPLAMPMADQRSGERGPKRPS